MSDNKNGWSSCMSWKKEGWYRMGTVEMMNSPMVVVAYLDSKTPMAIGDLPWSNKKWRQLFVVNDKCIASVKGYPYKNANLTKMALESLVNLAKENWGIEYKPQVWGGACCKDDFYTNFMYNDFTNTNDCYIYEKKNIHLSEPPVIIYSGKAECMCCGEEIEYKEGWDDSDFLICETCRGENCCRYCGEPLNNKYYILNGRKYCKGCYYENAAKEFGTNEIHHFNNLRSIFIRTTYNTELIYVQNYLDFELNYLKEDRSIQVEDYRCFIQLDDLKPEWQEYLNTYQPDDIWGA